MPVIEAKRGADGVFSVPVPAALRGRWCLFLLPGQRTGDSGSPPARVSMRLSEGRFPGIWGDLDLLPRRLGRIAGVQHLLTDTEALLLVLPDSAGRDVVRVRIVPVGAVLAALLVALLRPRSLFGALRNDWTSGLRGAFAMLTTPGVARRSYADWIAAFDAWPEERRALLASRRPLAARPRILVAIWPSSPDDPALRGATIDSIAAQIAPSPYVVMGASGGGATANGEGARAALGAAIAASAVDYVAILQAGEVLPPQALALMEAAIVSAGAPDALFADEDEVDCDGQRRCPHFKPQANHALMLSGTLTRGLWLFRREHLSGLVDPSCADADWAETLRLAAWLRLYRRAEAPRTVHLPHVLTHRQPMTETAPAASLAAVVRQHFARAVLPGVVSADALPLRIRMEPALGTVPLISLVVPTAARLEHVTRCLSAVLAGTSGVSIEVVLVLSQADAPDSEQRAVLAPVLRDPRVRTVLLDDAPFNYARANNRGVAASRGVLVCLLNDDVAPIEPSWLAALAGHLADPRVGAVAPKLLYPDKTVQHAGVIMGLSGLAGHAHLRLDRTDPGYCGRAVLAQEVSVVTGACLLVRRAAYDAVGGMDETFPIAFNDVDFCLKLRDAGWSVVLSAETELLHLESVSRGPHGVGIGAADEPAAAARLRARWAALAEEDPFYNPNLSLVAGREWTPAFPSRAPDPLALELAPASAADPVPAAHA